MRAPQHLRRLFLFVTLLVPGTASAANGLYAGLSLGYGSFSGNNLIITDTGTGDRPDTTPGTCCPKGGLAFEFRTGYGIFGAVAPEFVFIGDGWDLGSDAGGSGFIGGGLRLFPLGFLTLLDLDMSDIPIDIGIGGAFGYTVVGKDFAYTGSFFALDLTAEYLLSEVVSLGARITYIKPSYSGFVFTDYGDDLGRCLDSSGNQDGNLPPFKKGSVPCTGGKGPSTSFLAPQLVATFRIDLF
jgi:hypothetical protein